VLLYHYTNTAGMLGILRTRALWATDVGYLNDSKELLYGRDEVVSALLEEASRLNPDGLGGMTGDDDSNRATIMASAAHFLTEEEHRSYWGPYVACFSEEGDLLSQWRGYAASHGWALAFDLSALRDCAKSWTASESVVHKVVYGPAGIEGAVERVMARIAPEPTGHPGVKGDHRAHVVCRRELAFSKHPAFEEEHEWRLVIEQDGPAQPLDFREGPLGLTPYVTVNWPREALREVVVGPTALPALQHTAMRRLLGEHGYGQVPVRVSEAPFR